MKDLSSFSDFRLIRIIFLDFDGVFTDNSVFVDESGSEYVRCSRYDGFGLHALACLGIKVVVLTTETKPLASVRCAKLNIECHDSLSDKLEFARLYVESSSLTLGDVAFMGNDINDLSLLRNVRLPVVTADCHSSVLHPSFFQTKSLGGHGCIRELADHFLSS